MSEKELSAGGLPTDISDGANTKDDVEDSLFDGVKIRELKLTGPIKILLLLCCVVGIGFSAYSSNLFGMVIFAVSMVFILDLMGVMDKGRDWMKDVSRPKGNYDNIE
jgi:hypothetical protein